MQNSQSFDDKEKDDQETYNFKTNNIQYFGKNPRKKRINNSNDKT